MSLPITQPQRDLIDALRMQNNISVDVLDKLCMVHWEAPVRGLSRIQASVLIGAMKDKALIQREIQVIAGQQELFGKDVAS